MKAKLQTKLMILFVLCQLCAALSAQNRIAVLPFVANEGMNPFITSEVSTIFCEEISKITPSVIIEPDAMAKTLHTQSVADSRHISVSEAVRAAQTVEANTALIGQLSDEGMRYNMTLTVISIDVYSGTVRTTLSGSTMFGEQQIRRLSAALAKRLFGASGDQLFGGSSLQQDTLTYRQDKHACMLADAGTELNNGEEMLQWFRYYLGMGIAGLATESVMLPTGIGLMSGLGYYGTLSNNMVVMGIGLGIGGGLIALDLILCPILCVIGFVRMGRTYAVYRKASGNRKFRNVPRVGISGGYDWQNGKTAFAVGMHI